MSAEKGKWSGNIGLFWFREVKRANGLGIEKGRISATYFVNAFIKGPQKKNIIRGYFVNASIQGKKKKKGETKTDINQGSKNFVNVFIKGKKTIIRGYLINAFIKVKKKNGRN